MYTFERLQNMTELRNHSIENMVYLSRKRCRTARGTGRADSVLRTTARSPARLLQHYSDPNLVPTKDTCLQAYTAFLYSLLLTVAR